MELGTDGKNKEQVMFDYMFGLRQHAGIPYTTGVTRHSVLFKR